MKNPAAVIGVGQTRHRSRRTDVSIAGLCREAADRALFGAIHDGLDTKRVELVEMDTDINDDRFADAMADRLHQLITKE